MGVGGCGGGGSGVRGEVGRGGREVSRAGEWEEDAGEVLDCGMGSGEEGGEAGGRAVCRQRVAVGRADKRGRGV